MGGGLPTNSWLWAPIALHVHIRRRSGARVTKFIMTFSLPHSLSNQSIRRSNGRKLHTAPSTQAPQSHRLVPDPDLLLIHRAGGCLVDLLPRLRQVPLRRLLRCQVLRPRPPVRYANPNPKDLSHSITLDRLDAALTDQKNDQKL
jgi:hypothetical protein